MERHVFAYIRVSTKEQHTDRQEQAIKEHAAAEQQFSLCINFTASYYEIQLFYE